MKTLVLGIGNTLLSDEGVGIHTLTYLQTHHPDVADVNYLDGGTLSFTLAPAIEEAENLIVIDAAQLHALPGTVKCFVNADMDKFLATHHRSVHEVGMVDLLTIAQLTDCLPKRRALVGIQPQELDWGETASPAVAAAIPQAADYVMQLITEWHNLK